MSASHNPGGPEYDWGIKVTFLINSHQLEEDSVIFYLMYMLRYVVVPNSTITWYQSLVRRNDELGLTTFPWIGIRL